KNNKDENGNLRSRPQSTDFYFREAIMCAGLTVARNSFRYLPKGFIFDVNLRVSFSKTESLLPVLGFSNSVVVENFLKITSPTVAVNIQEFEGLPFLQSLNTAKLRGCVDRCIQIARDDWDSFEKSWDFKTFPILNLRSAIDKPLTDSIEECWNRWEALCTERIYRMQELETE